MGAGLIIAKDGATIHDSRDKLYVDPDTFLFKVMKNVAGALRINGDGTFTSLGALSWVLTSSSSSNNIYTLTVPYDGNIKYIPQYEAFMDKIANNKRTRLMNLVGGISADGDNAALVQANNLGVMITATVRKDLTTLPIPGTYGYYIQIYYDKAQ